MKNSVTYSLDKYGTYMYTNTLNDASIVSLAAIRPLQIKAVDAGSPPKFSTAQLHLESVHQAPPSTPPLAFQEPFYNFTVLENSGVAQVVGLVSMTRSSTGLWFDFSGKIHLHPSLFFLFFLTSEWRACLNFFLRLSLSLTLAEAPRSSREVFYVLPGPCIRNCSLEGTKAFNSLLSFCLP